MKTERADWIKRIVALTNHVNHPNASPEEAASAAALAAKLMLQFQIEDAELVREGARQRSAYTARKLHRVRSTFEQRLLNALAHANFCTVIAVHSATTLDAEIIGMEDACEIVEYLYLWFKREVDRLARAGYKALTATSEGRERKWIPYHTSFRMGALLAIREKLKAQREEAERGAQAEQVQALIVLRDADLAEAVAARYPNLKETGWRRVTVDGDAYSAGYDAGKTLAAPRALRSGQES